MGVPEGELTESLSPRSYHRWVSYFRVKERDDWERREKWEIYAADVLDLLWFLIRRVDGVFRPSKLPSRNRKDFLIDFRGDRAAKKIVPEVQEFERKLRRNRKSKRKRREQEIRDRDNGDMVLWAAILKEPEIVPHEVRPKSLPEGKP